MPDFGAWLAAALVAGASGAALAWMATRLRNAASRDYGGRMLLALVAAAILGHLVLGLWPNWPASSALDRLLAVGLPVAAVMVWILQRLTGRLAWRSIVTFVLAIALGRWLLDGSVYTQEAAWRLWAPLAAWAGMLSVVDLSLARLARHEPAAPLPITVAGTLLVAGVCVLFAGYIKGGSLAVPWAAALAGCYVGARRFPAIPNVEAATCLALITLWSVLMIGCYFGRVTVPWAIAVLLTPLLSWVTEWPASARVGGKRRHWLGLTLVSLAWIALLAAASVKFEREMAPAFRPAESVR